MGEPAAPAMSTAGGSVRSWDHLRYHAKLGAEPNSGLYLKPVLPLFASLFTGLSQTSSIQEACSLYIQHGRILTVVTVKLLLLIKPSC